MWAQKYVQNLWLLTKFERQKFFCLIKPSSSFPVFGSSGGGDSNAVILPNKRRSKRKGTNQVRAEPKALISFFSAVSQIKNFSNLIGLGVWKTWYKKNTEDDQIPGKEVAKVGGMSMYSFVYFCLILLTWHGIVCFLFCRRRREMHFCYPKALRPWGKSIFPILLSPTFYFVQICLLSF